jgi:O-antigen/teichoic acid export membrane protein
VKFTKNEFIKSVVVLMTGTVIAQVFSVLISPILTRIYTPEEMGDLNIYLRAVGFLSAVATTRYELSLPLPKKEEHAYLLYRLSIRISIYVLLGSCFLFFVYFLFTKFDIKTVNLAVFTLISSVFLVLINLGTNWAIRKKQFKKISTSRMLNSISSNLLRWLFGVMGMGSFGLLIASLVGYVLSSLTFFKEWFKINKVNRSFRSDGKTKVLMNTYREFPAINLPHVMVDLGKDLLLAFFMVFFFSKDVFGWYSHSYAILQMPISIIGISIGQVFFNRAAEIVNNGGSTLGLLKKTIGVLFAISILPFTVLFFFGTPMFSFVFGREWAQAGHFSEIMSIWFFMNFLNSVISTLPTILHRQKQFLYLGILSAAIQLFCFGALPILIGRTDQDFIQILWIVSIAQSVFFCFVLLAMFSFAKAGYKTR